MTSSGNASGTEGGGLDSAVVERLLSKTRSSDWLVTSLCAEDHFHWTPNQAIDFCRSLYDGRLDALGFPDRLLNAEQPLSGSTENQLERYMTSSGVYRRCREVIWVEAADDHDAVTELQRLVRNRYASTGITIEVNPISNLMVGDLTDLTGHPLWRLAPGLGDEFGATLRMCVGSDDPLPFATNLPEEYQFLYDSLLLAGQSHAAARRWIDQIRETGMESRFTQPMSAVDSVRR